MSAAQVINMGRVLFLLSFLTIIPSGLAAQGRGGMPARAAAAAPAVNVSAAAHPGVGVRTSVMPGHAVAQAPGSPASHLVASRAPNGQVILRRSTTTTGAHSSITRANGTVVRGVVRNGQLSSTQRRRSNFGFSPNSGSVPGLGFDFVHTAATHPNVVSGRHHRFNNGAVLFPFSGGGYFLPTEPIVEGQDEGQPEEDAEDEAVPAERPARVRSVDRAPLQPVLEEPAPQTDVPEFVFVRRDGTVFFAVAYSWEKDALRYISSEGLRRTVSRETLDLDATQHFNEQRGMTFRAPA
jgi:hypothetical protein